MNCQYKTYCGEDCNRNPLTCMYFQTLVNFEERMIRDREITAGELSLRIIDGKGWWER